MELAELKLLLNTLEYSDEIDGNVEIILADDAQEGETIAGVFIEDGKLVFYT